MRRVLLGAAVLGAVLGGAGLVAARGTLMSDQNVGGGGGGGLAIGDAVSGGTAGRLLFEGAGPVLDDSPAFTVNDGTSLRQMLIHADPAPSVAQAQVRVDNASTSTNTVTSDFVALNYRSDYMVARIYGATSGNDELGLTLAHQARWQCSTDADCIVVAQGGSLRLANANRAGNSGTIGITINGSGVQLPTYSIEQVGGVPTHLNKGHCTLNGSSPAQCSVSVTGSSLGGTLECVCSIKALGHKGGCQTHISGSTLTLTTDNGITDDAAYICW